MGTKTGISWTDKTFNIVWGCQHYSELCDFCYAERWDAYVNSSNPHWGTKAPRMLMSEKYWKNPINWNQDAKSKGTNYKVFCSSMADVFEDHPTVAQERKKLFPLIKSTPALNWQLLTKRWDRIQEFLPEDWNEGYDNAWLGVSVGLQKRVDQYLPTFIAIPSKVRFISCEPLLGPIDLTEYLKTGKIHQVIVGGESGFGKLPNDPDVKYRYRITELVWIESIVKQCKENNVPVFIKQLGTHLAKTMKLQSKTGADINEFPENIRFQEFPN